LTNKAERDNPGQGDKMTEGNKFEMLTASPDQLAHLALEYPELREPMGQVAQRRGILPETQEAFSLFGQRSLFLRALNLRVAQIWNK